MDIKNKFFLKTEKGTVQDIPVQIVLLFQFGLGVAVAYLLYNRFTQFAFFKNTLPMQKVGEALTVLDYSAVLIMVGFFVASFVFASRIRTSKLFLPISFLFLVLSSWISAIFANIWSVTIKSSAFSSVANSVPFLSKILFNLPVLIFASGTLIIIALYSRVGGGRRVAR